MPEPRLDDDTFAGFRDSVQRFVRERLVPAEPEAIAQNWVPEAVLDEMRELGLFGLTVPVEYGGSGLQIDQYLEIIRELAWAAPAFRSALAINTGILTSALTQDGTPDQKMQWLPKIAKGHIGSFALTEPDSGSDSAALQTSAMRDGDSYVINGSKRYITNGPKADFALVMVRTTRETLPSNGHISGFIVPLDAPGVARGKPDKKMGQTGALTSDLYFDNVRVPAANLLGGVEGCGFKTAMKALDGGRLSIAAASIGYGQRILATALRYATERKAFGETIAGFQLIQAMLADSEVELYAATCMMRDAARLAAGGQRILKEGAATKLFASEAVGRIADRCVQIYGGSGYMAEYEAERFYRDVRVYRIYEGTSQILQLVIARAMLREFAAG